VAPPLRQEAGRRSPIRPVRIWLSPEDCGDPPPRLRRDGRYATRVSSSAQDLAQMTLRTQRCDRIKRPHHNAVDGLGRAEGELEVEIAVKVRTGLPIFWGMERRRPVRLNYFKLKLDTYVRFGNETPSICPDAESLIYEANRWAIVMRQDKRVPKGLVTLSIGGTAPLSRKAVEEHRGAFTAESPCSLRSWLFWIEHWAADPIYRQHKMEPLFLMTIASGAMPIFWRRSLKEHAGTFITESPFRLSCRSIWKVIFRIEI
jgi:hypothetical protein